MAGLTWLHLSDWHQKGREFDRKVVRDALLRDLRERAKIAPGLGEVDFVVFSGDVAWQGQAEEYATARREFFEPVLKELGLTSKKLFIAPGNHDLNRQTVEEMLPEGLKKPLENDEQVQRWLTDEKKRARALEPFEDFASYVASYTGQSPPAYANTWLNFIGDKRVGILCLNSAWMCGRQKEANGEVNDYGFLSLGEPQIHDALGAIEAADVRIAVLHHSFAWLAEFDRNRIEERLKRTCHFILHGHEHVPKFNLAHELSGECAIIPAGACYERRTAANPRYTNAYNFVHLDFETGQGLIYLRRWSNSRNAWIEDTDSHCGGKFPFPLPKELGSVQKPVQGMMTSHHPETKRFAVALSFPSEHRDFVGELAASLAREVTRERVLYDKFWEAEFARLDLDVYLPSLYRDESELVVIFLCPEYKKKRWCRLEWRHIKQLIATIQEDRIMLVSFGDPGDMRELGILPGDGYIDIGSRPPEEIAPLILQRMAREPKTPPSPSFSPAITEYLRRLEAATSKLQLIGLGQGVQIELPIQQAFIPLNVVVAHDLKNEQCLRFDEKALHQRERFEEDVLLCDMFKWATRFESRGVLLLGDPGAGKTTGARQFCWRILTEPDLPKSLGLPAETTPVFLRLRHLTPHHLGKGLPAFIADAVASAALAPDLANPAPDLLARRGVLWVFDGLDEVVNENARVHVCNWIKKAQEDRPDDFFLVTSRYQGYQGKVNLGPAFCQFHVKPLNETQVTQFVDHWYRSVLQKLHGQGADIAERAGKEIGSLLAMLQEPEYRIGRLRELPANPLMLTILCVVHHQDRNLPRRRADLYAKCVRVLVEHWRKEVLDSQGVEGFDPESAESVLSTVAWWLHGQDNRTSQTIEELGRVAAKALADLAQNSGLGRDGQTFIRRMRDQSGILTMWSAGQCGFLHLTFQEYLAGLHAAREGRAEDLVKHVGQSWWREAILVAVAVGSKEFSRKFFVELLETDALAKEGPFVDQCLDEARYPVLDPFLDAMREKDAKPERQLDILRRLRQFDHPDLFALCRELARSKHVELASLAREILERAKIPIERPAIEVAGAPLELRVDPHTGMAFVQIPAGEFDMGSGTGTADEKPVHRVRISRPFLLGKYPVTNAEYERFLKGNSKVQPPDYWNNSQFNDPQQPVVGVSWEDARLYCQWAGFRLPTEAEWEYACRAGSKGAYCFGNDASKLGDHAWYFANSGGKTQAVGQRKPNQWGLYDMHGNVWEWCQDWYRPYSKEPVTDPSGPENGTIRVLRGGSWGNDGPEVLRCSSRNFNPPVISRQLWVSLCVGDGGFGS